MDEIERGQDADESVHTLQSRGPVPTDPQVWAAILKDPAGNGLSPKQAKRLRAQLSKRRRPKGTPGDEASKFVAWYDATLEADHWFSLQDVEPLRAAMLLCRFNPNEESLEQAMQTTNDVTRPEDLLRLHQRLEDQAKCTPQPRSLFQWRQFAQASKLLYHPWIDEYITAAGIDAPDATTEALAHVDADSDPAPGVSAVAVPDDLQVSAPPAVAHKLKGRADRLSAVIALAGKRAVDPTDWQSVWAALVALAEDPDRPAPLLGYSEGDGVKYQTDSDQQPVKFLTRDAFRKRHSRNR